MSSVSEISDAILKNRIIKEPDSIDAKGKKIVNDFKEAAPDMVKAFSDNPIYKILTPLASKVMMPSKNNTILIFDDFERCSIDTLELMGFINNLCENDEYRTIVIANENEVKKYDSESGQESDQLDAQYKRTREKLIGHTIRLESNIDTVYDDILEDAVKNQLAKYRLSQNKSLICHCFRDKECQNLRTLISVFKCAESIIKAIDSQIPFPDFGILDKEEISETVDKTWESLLNYIANSAINLAKGTDALVLDSPYKLILNDIPNITSESNTCVDGYWKSLMIDSQEVTSKFREDVEARLNLCAKAKKDINHKNLAFFRLKSWTSLTDEELKKNLFQLKEELKADKYYVQEYCDIVFVLMSIADMNTGVITYDIENFNIPDSWEQVDVSEYVKLMKLTDAEGEELTRGMLFSATIRDQSNSFIANYRSFVEPLAHQIALVERQNNLKCNPFDNNAADFAEIIEENKKYYASVKRFLSLYDNCDIEKIISSDNLSQISALADAIKKIYANYEDDTYYSADIHTLTDLYKNLNLDRIAGRKKYNKSLSRTVEIALCTLEFALKSGCGYQDTLSHVVNPCSKIEWVD